MAIDHDPGGCEKWRGIEESDDFRGRTITWDDSTNGFGLEMTRVYPPTKPNSFGKEQWSYKFFDGRWDDPEIAKNYDAPLVPIFEGDEFWSPGQMETPEIVSAILGFLSLQPGDVESEYFDNYTERQIAWRDERAEELSFIRMEQFDD